MSEPRYCNDRVKLTNPSVTGVLSFVEFVVHGMFAFGLPRVVFIVVISGVYSSSSIGVVGSK